MPNDVRQKLVVEASLKDSLTQPLQQMLKEIKTTAEKTEKEISDSISNGINIDASKQFKNFEADAEKAAKKVRELYDKTFDVDLSPDEQREYLKNLFSLEELEKNGAKFKKSLKEEISEWKYIVEEGLSGFSSEFINEMKKLTNIDSTKFFSGFKLDDKLDETKNSLRELLFEFSKFAKEHNKINTSSFFDELKQQIEEGDDSLKELLSDLEMVDSKTNSINLVSEGNVKSGGIIGDDKVLLASKHGKKRLDEIQQIQSKIDILKSEGVNVARILKYEYDEVNDTLFEIQEKAKGKILGNIYGDIEDELINEDVFKATDAQIQKLIEDLWKLNQAGVGVDVNLGNLLYDSKEGFSIIDTDAKPVAYKNFQEFLDDIKGGFTDALRLFYEDINDKASINIVDAYENNLEKIANNVFKKFSGNELELAESDISFGTESVIEEQKNLENAVESTNEALKEQDTLLSNKTPVSNTSVKDFYEKYGTPSDALNHNYWVKMSEVIDELGGKFKELDNEVDDIFSDDRINNAFLQELVSELETSEEDAQRLKTLFEEITYLLSDEGQKQQGNNAFIAEQTNIDLDEVRSIIDRNLNIVDRDSLDGKAIFGDIDSSKLDKVNQELEETRTNLVNSEAEAEDLRQQLNASADEVGHLTEEIGRLESELSNVKDDLDIERGVSNDATEQYFKESAKNDYFQNQIDHLREDNARLEGEKANLLTELERSELRYQEKQIQNQTEANNSLIEEKEKLELLGETLREVSNLVDIKTDAFENERVAVVNALEQEISKLEELRLNLNSVTDLLNTPIRLHIEDSNLDSLQHIDLGIENLNRQKAEIEASVKQLDSLLNVFRNFKAKDVSSIKSFLKGLSDITWSEIRIPPSLAGKLQDLVLSVQYADKTSFNRVRDFLTSLGEIKNLNSVRANLVNVAEGLRLIVEQIKDPSISQALVALKDTVSVLDKLGKTEIKNVAKTISSPKKTAEEKAAEKARKEEEKAIKKNEKVYDGYIDKFKKLKREFESYEKQTNDMENPFGMSDEGLEEASEKIREIKSRIEELNNLKTEGKILTEEEIEGYENLVSEVGTFKNTLLSTYKYTKNTQATNSLHKIGSLLNKNTAYSKEAREELENLYNEIASSKGKIAASRLSEINSRINEISASEEKAGRSGASFWRKTVGFLDQANQRFLSQYFSWMDIIRYIRTTASVVVELDSALTELRKVSDTSTERLSQSFEESAKTAKELGSTITDVINVTSDWARLGYNVDQAEELARVTTLFQNVGDNMSAEDASSYLISTLQGFHLVADDAEDVIDKYNEVANNFAIDTAGIGEALKRSSASLYAANTDLSKSIALVTTANTVLQDPDSVGTVFKTMSARIRGAKTELEELGEEEDDFTKTTSKLRDLVKGLTGFDIMEDEDTFKDIYEILIGIGEQWDKLTDVERQSLAEALAGKRGAQAFYAVIQNIDTLKRAYETAENASGSAAKEQENYAQSIQYSIDQAKASLQELAHDFLSSDVAKAAVDLFTKIIQGLDYLVKHLGSVGSILTTIAGWGLLQLLIKGSIKGSVDKLTKSVGELNTILGNSSTTISNVSSNTAKLTTIFTNGATRVGGFTNSLKGLSGASSVLLPALGALVAIIGELAIFDALTIDFKESKKAVEDAKVEYEQASLKLEDINSEMKSLDQQIQELKSKGQLNLTDQQDLERLIKARQETELLAKAQEQITEAKNKAYLKEITEDYNRRINNSSEKSFKKEDFLSSIFLNTITMSGFPNIFGGGKYLGNYVRTGSFTGTPVDDAILKYNELNQKKEEKKLELNMYAEAEGDQSKYIEKINQEIDNLETKISNSQSDIYTLISEYQNNILAFEAVGVENLTDSQKKVYEGYKENLRQLYEAVDPASWNNTRIESVISRLGLTDEELTELAKTGVDSTDSVEGLTEALGDADLILEDGLKPLDLFNQYLLIYKEETQLASNSTSQWAIALAEALEKLGTSEDDFNKLVNSIKELNPELNKNQEAAERAALANLQFSKATEDLRSNFETYKESINQGNKLSVEYNDAITGLAEDLTYLTGIDFSLINTEQWAKDEENIKLLDQALEGVPEALEKIRTNAQDELIINIKARISEIDDSQVEDIAVKAKLNTDQFSTELQNLVGWMENSDLGIIEATAALDDAPFMATLATLASDSSETAQAIQAIFEQLGWDMTWDLKEMPVPSVKGADGARQGYLPTDAHTGMGTGGDFYFKMDKVDVPTNIRFTKRGSTAGTTNKYTPSSIPKSSDKSSGSGGGGGSDKEETPEIFDWIETRISRLERDIQNFDKVVNASYKNWGERLGAIPKEYDKVLQEIETQNAGYARYMQEASKVGLPEEYAQKVREGMIDIESITDETLKQGINDYKQWYEKAIQCADAVEDLRARLAELAKLKFDNIASIFDSVLESVTHLNDLINTAMDTVETQGYLVSKAYYQKMTEYESYNLSKLEQEYEELKKARQEALDSGAIEENSQDWWDMQHSIEGVESAIYDAKKALAEYADAMRQIEWDLFDRTQGYISQITDESDWIQALLRTEHIITNNETGRLNEYGKSIGGLVAVDYNVYMRQSQMYADEIEKINKELANDPYNTKLIDRRNELLNLQRQSIQAAEDEKEAIRSLIKESYDEMLRILQELIDKRKEALQAEKDLYDYQKNIQSQADNINSLRKQIMALSGDESEENQARLQSLRTDLKNAESDLEDTEYDKWLSDQNEAMDNMYQSAEDFLNERLKNIDLLVSEVIATTNESAELISDTINTEVTEVGYNLTSEMESIWDGQQRIVSDFHGTFVDSVGQIIDTQYVSTIAVCDSIAAYTVSMMNNSNAIANSILSNINQNSSQIFNNINATINAINQGTSSITSYLNSILSACNNIAAKVGTGGGGGSSSNSSSGGTSSYSTPISSNGQPWYYSADSGKQYDLIQNQINSQKGTGSVVIHESNGYAWKKKIGYAEGGTIGKALKITGEDGIILAKTGEEVLSLEKIAAMKDVLQAFEPLALAVTKMPSIASVHNTASGNNEFNISFEFPNVYNYEDFIQTARTDSRFERIVQQMTIGNALGGNTLKKYTL